MGEQRGADPADSRNLPAPNENIATLKHVINNIIRYYINISVLSTVRFSVIERTAYICLDRLIFYYFLYVLFFLYEIFIYKLTSKYSLAILTKPRY